MSDNERAMHPWCAGNVMILLPLAPPTQPLEEHHGIVMNWARRNLEQSDLKDPGELVIAAMIAGNGPGNPGNKYYSSAIWSLEAIVASREIGDDF
jgi:hypothetical protein